MTALRPFNCAGCGRDFLTSTSEAETDAEYRRRFPGRENEPRSRVCIPCSKKIDEFLEARRKGMH